MANIERKEVFQEELEGEKIYGDRAITQSENKYSEKSSNATVKHAQIPLRAILNPFLKDNVIGDGYFHLCSSLQNLIVIFVLILD